MSLAVLLVDWLMLLLRVFKIVLNFGKVEISACRTTEDVQNINARRLKMARGVVCLRNENLTEQQIERRTHNMPSKPFKLNAGSATNAM
jgi:hypothetical protein